MQVVPLLESHLEELQPQEAQAFIGNFLANEDYRAQLCFMPHSYAGVLDGRVIGIAGVAMIYPHIGTAWAILSNDSQKNMLRLTRAIKGFLDSFDCKRIETHVKHDFTEGHRWAEMLGFKNETPDGMNNYGIDGETYDLYARCK